MNINIFYDLDATTNDFNTNLENCLFGSVKKTKNSDVNTYVYNGYGLPFYTGDFFIHPQGGIAYNVIVFGADKPENVLVLGKGSAKINNKTVDAVKIYTPNISTTVSKRVLSLHYNKQNSHILVNNNEIAVFTAKDSEINNDPICLGNISKDFSETNTETMGLYRSVYYFSIDDNPTSTDYISKIHKYLINKFL